MGDEADKKLTWVMGNEADKKLTWVIKTLFTTWRSSDIFVVGRCKWRLLARFERKKGNGLSLFLVVADFLSLPCGWRRHIKLRLHVINQSSEKRSKVVKETKVWLHDEGSAWGFYKLPLTKLDVKDGGFLENGEVKIVAEIDVLQVIGDFDVPDEAENSTQPLKKRKLNETVDVNDFQILPSHVESVRRIFEKYPDFASKLCSKNRHLKSTYLNVLLGAIEMLCQSPQELSDDDLDEASVALSYVAKGGFEVDWLEKKLEEVKEKKKKVDTAKASLQQMEQELQNLNQKCFDLKALVEKKKADVSASNVALSFHDLV